MGEESHGMTAEEIEKKDHEEADPQEEVRKLERQIKQTRNRLGKYLVELDKRRHALARTLKRTMKIGAALSGAALGIAIVFKIRRNARRQS